MTVNSTHFAKQVESLVAKNLSKTNALDRWQQAFDASPDFISILDKNHSIVTINDAMAKAMGIRPEEAEGKTCCNLVHKTDRPPISCPHKRLMEDGKTHQSEVYDENLNMWFLISVTPLYDDQGQLEGSIHIARDITQLKKIEQALRESQERYRHLSEATQEGVLLSLQDSIIAANQVLADMTGYDADELKGQSLLQFISPHERHDIVQYLKNGKGDYIECNCVKKDGTLFPVEAHSKLISYKGEMVYQTAIRNLTQQKRIQQERAEHERLQGVFEMAGAICHELNQPLTAIYGYLDLLALKLPNEGPLADRYEDICGQLKRIQSITHKLTHITHYKTKSYAGGEHIIDLDESASEDEVDKQVT